MADFNMDFGFNDVPEVSNGGNFMAPWTIQDVCLKKTEIIEGEKDGTPWKAIDITFVNTEGQEYRERLFYPDPKKGRGQGNEATDKNGRKFTPELPAPMERAKAMIAQILTVLTPKGFAKFKELSTKFKSFDDVAKVFVKLTNDPAVTSVQTKLKLTGKTREGYVNASLPNFARINASGQLYVKAFLGNKIAFDNWEKTQADNYHNSKPTKMDDGLNISSPSYATNTNVGASQSEVDSLLDDIELL